MKYLLLLILPLVLSCQKELPETTSTQTIINCDLLQQGLTENDVAMIDQSLGKLLDVEYSNENLNQLASEISSDCDLSATLTCFDCIQTLPAQSDMTVAFLYNGDATTRELDFIPGVNNKSIILISVQ